MRNQFKIQDSRFKIQDLKSDWNNFEFLNLKFVILLVFLSSSLFAQDFKREYRKAKGLFADGHFSAAMDAFKPLMVYDRNNPYPEYASFYYALSAQRLGFAALAKENFLQLKKIYPQWDQLDEVNYWLVKLYLDQREYFHALLLAKEIKNPSLKKELDALKRLALSSVDDVETLMMLLEENKEDAEVAMALAYAIGKQAPLFDSKLMDSITTQYHWNKEDFVSVQALQPIFKEQYRIALLLPFRTSTLDPGPAKKKSQFVLDMYEGMKLAADSLAAEGTKLELLAYDTDHDLDAIKKLLKEDELKTADLMVGPLFMDDAKPVHEFSQANKINLVVNPLSYNNDLLAQNPYSFLFQPSHATIGKKSAEVLAAKVFNKKCFVFFGESPKDSVMAFSFMRTATELGMKVCYAEEVRSETSGSILATLATATEYDKWKNPKQFKLKLDSIGSIFVASDDPLIYTKVINSVEARGDSVLVVGQESWLEDNSVNLAKFERIRMMLAAPNFSSVFNRPYLHFRKKYLQAHGVLPSLYAQKGFEFMMVVGHALKKYGVYFQNGLQQEGVPGALGLGYRMLPSHDNGTVPFIVLKGGMPEVINKP